MVFLLNKNLTVKLKIVKSMLLYTSNVCILCATGLSLWLLFVGFSLQGMAGLMSYDFMKPQKHTRILRHLFFKVKY